MKHLMTLAALFVSSLAMAQDYPEYPFPYNPDGNADGYIGLTDLLDLLVVYGQEYPGSFYGDSTGAILNVGEMTFSECLNTEKVLGNSWRGLKAHDFHRWLDEILQQGLASYQSLGYSFNYTGWVHMEDNDPGHFVVQYHPDYEAEINGNILPIRSDRSYIESQDYDGGDYYGAHFYFHTTRQCFLITEALPEIEYGVIQVSGNVSAISDSLSNGWKPLGGVSSAGEQALWRFAQ